MALIKSMLMVSDFANSESNLATEVESSVLLLRAASGNVNSTNNALPCRWHLPPNTAADNPNNRETKFALYDMLTQLYKPRLFLPCCLSRSGPSSTT
jgi:hypothetical protein